MLRRLVLWALLMTPAGAFASVDLHMHLTMEIPLKGVYTGHLLEKVAVEDVGSRFKSRIDFETLEQSGLRLVVAALVANPLSGHPIDQIEVQVRLLREFCKKYPKWKIVAEPDEVSAEITKGNNVFLLSLEGAWFFQDKEMFRQMMARFPFRIVTPFHFTDFKGVVGKVAHQRGIVGWLQSFFEFFHKKRAAPVSPLGDDLLRFMLEQKIWIDLSHAPRDVIDHFLKLRPPGYPILVTHTILGKYYQTERGIDMDLLAKMRSENGAVGLMPSMEMLVGTPEKKGDCAQRAAFLVQWNELVAAVGPKKVYLGSDLNSPIPTLAPLPPDPACPAPFLGAGLITAKDLKDIVALEDKNAIDNFIKTWKLVRR